MATDLPLSGPMSTRALGTQSGAMNREARALRRKGYGRASEQMAFAASNAKLGEGGALTSRDSNLAEQAIGYQRSNVLAGMRNRALQEMGSANAGNVNRPTGFGDGVQGSKPANNLGTGVKTPGLDSNPVRTTPAQTFTGGTQSSTNPARPAAPSAPAAPTMSPQATPPPGTPPLLARPMDRPSPSNVAPPLLANPGQIDGKPAGSVLAGMRADAGTGERKGILGRMLADESTGASSTDASLARINSERAAAGKPTVQVSGEELANADVSPMARQNITNAEAGRDAGILASIRKPREDAAAAAKAQADEAALQPAREQIASATAADEAQRDAGILAGIRKDRASAAPTASPTPSPMFPGGSYPNVKNPDGSSSNVKLASFNVNGKERVIPTMVGGKQLSNREALDAAEKNGFDKYPAFDTPEQATKFAQENHGRIDERGYLRPTDYRPSMSSPVITTREDSDNRRLQKEADDRLAADPELRRLKAEQDARNAKVDESRQAGALSDAAAWKAKQEKIRQASSDEALPAWMRGTAAGTVLKGVRRTFAQ